MNTKVLTIGSTVLLLIMLSVGVVAAQGNGDATQGPRTLLNRLSSGRERVIGSGRAVSETFDIRGFSRVDVSHAFDVKIVQGSSYRVVVRVDEELKPHLRVEKRGDTLIIGLKPMRRHNYRNVTMEAEVQMPDLRGVEASGATDIRISGFSSAKDFDADLSGASYLEGNITAQDVSIEASGASHVRLKGKAEDLRLDISGASSVDLESFPAEDAEIELSGASEADVELSGILDVDASGASHLYFGGNPTMGRVDLSGASSIKRR
jgi:hypothetical protein